MKKLGIKGHPTRGKEIIELLEMMGGMDTKNMEGKNPLLVYYINEHGDIDYINDCNPNENIIRSTLEDFLEKFPFKIGDKIFMYDDITEGCVNGMKWDKDKETVKYCVYTSTEFWCDVKDMKKDKTELKPEKIESNAIKIVDGKVVDGLEKTHKLGPKSKLSPQYYENKMYESEKTDTPKAPILSNREDYAEGKFGYLIPNGYEFDSIKDNQIIIRSIKSKYPKTYKECCDILLISQHYNLRWHTYERGYYAYATSNNLLSLENKLNTLGKLLICREAYWKVAGEGMGLGKPWKPDWCDENEYKYGLFRLRNLIYKDVSAINPTLLIFPTIEMRDAFYENFKYLIEQCKELL